MDIRTLLLAQTAVSAAMAAMFWFARGRDDRANGLHAWTLALTAQGAACLIFASAGYAAPLFVAIVGNAMRATATVLSYVAIRQFLGRPFGTRGLAVLFGIVAAAGAASEFDLSRSFAYTGLGCGLLQLLNGRELLVSKRPGVWRVQRVVAVFHLAIGVLMPVRAVMRLSSPSEFDAPFDGQQAVYLFWLLFIVVSNLGFLQMCKIRAESALRVQAMSALRLSMHNEELLAQRTAQEQEARGAQARAEQACERAEAADRSKTSFMAAASHDLRQPMHALVQYVEHLRRICHGHAAISTVEKIGDSVSAMEDLLNAVLDFSKISMGSIKPRIERVSLARLCASIDTQLRPMAEAEGLAFQVDGASGWVWSDEVLLERIVRNIAQNAVRYTDQGRVVVRASVRGECVRILVGDSGVGIPAAERERVFEEFYQLDNPARDRRKGLGLGLAIVRDLAALLGVRVRLKSVPGRGSIFAVEVRRADAPPHAVAATSAGIDYVRGAFVVLIDDDPMALDGVATTLRDFGCRVLAAASAVEALRRLAEVDFVPQIVISDYRLGGGVTGLDAIATVTGALASLCGEAFRPPAIVVSGDTSPHELKRVGDAGYLMLHKPVGVAPLHGALNALLGRAGQAA